MQDRKTPPKHEKQRCKRSPLVFPNDIKRKPPRSVYRQTQQASEISLRCYREITEGYEVSALRIITPLTTLLENTKKHIIVIGVLY